MSRLASMTFGLILIFLGAQLYLVKSYLLTPSATRFMAEHMGKNSDSRFSSGTATGNPSAFPSAFSQPGQSWPYYQTSQAGYSSSTTPAQFASVPTFIPPGYQHRLVLPGWIMWPVLFVGVVFFLHGLALRG